MWALANRILLLFTSILIFLGLFIMAFPSTAKNFRNVDQSEKNILPLFHLRGTQECSLSDKGILSLKNQEVEIYHPDLSDQFIFFGQNTRPDADFSPFFILEKPISQEKVLFPNSMYYIRDNKGHPSNYSIFSPETQPTPLWLECSGTEDLLTVSLFYGSLENQRVLLKSYFFPKQEYSGQDDIIKIGSFFIDPHILMRQRACWVGPDLFLTHYGGIEYLNQTEKHRIDFQNEENHYSCFVGEGDVLSWEEDHWELLAAEEKAQKHILMRIEKIENRLMHLKLWSSEGKKKVLCILSRFNVHEIPKELQPLKYIGARTHRKWLFESNHKRICLGAGDWLLHSKEFGWVKLNTPQDIEAYLKQEIKGELFIVKKLMLKEGQKILSGNLFNISRTDFKEIDVIVEDTKQKNQKLSSRYKSFFANTAAPKNPTTLICTQK